MKKKSIFFNKKHILHRLDGLTDVGFSTYTGTHKTGYPCVCKWLPMWRLWLTHSLWKKIIFFNLDHILHRLYGLTDVIWVILSKQKLLHQLFLRTEVIYIYIFFTLFWNSHCSFACNLTLSRHCHVCSVKCVLLSEGVNISGLLLFINKAIDDFLQQVHHFVISNNVSLRMDIEPTRNSWIFK